MVCIDVFSKYAVVVPIKSKSEGNVAAGILESINKIGKPPQIIYTDNEGALNSTSLHKHFKEQDIKHIITRTHAQFAERFIRTVKSGLYKRVENAENKENQISSGSIMY